MSSFRRHARINHLHAKAKTGKYNWDQLRAMALAIPVSEPTAKKYIDEVRARLIKEGLIKE